MCLTRRPTPSLVAEMAVRRAVKGLIMELVSCVEVLTMGGPWGCRAPYCPDNCGER